MPFQNTLFSSAAFHFLAFHSALWLTTSEPRMKIFQQIWYNNNKKKPSKIENLQSEQRVCEQQLLLPGLISETQHQSLIPQKAIKKQLNLPLLFQRKLFKSRMARLFQKSLTPQKITHEQLLSGEVKGLIALRPLRMLLGHFSSHLNFTVTVQKLRNTRPSFSLC